jgi:cholesterol transport system auxiliary component
MKIHQYGMLMLLGLGLSACSFGPVKVPNANTYVLSDISSQAAYPKVLSESLTVMPVVASRGFDSTAMMYQATPYQLTSFAQNTWAAPPANMITPLLLKSLQRSQLFKTVILGPAMSSTSYGLNTTLLGLYQDFTVKPSQIVLSLNVSLGNNQTNQVVADKVIMVRVKATAENPYAGVVAANVALSQSMDDVVQFVNASLSQS